ncbi:MAG: tetratricopeptide repeat protein [Candidatus Omnitrophota bacterium]
MKRLNSRTLIFIHIGVLIISGLLIYGNSLNGKFIWDDNGLIKNNNYIKDWKYLPEIIKSDFGSGGDTKSNYYRPLQMVLHMAGYSLWGRNVQGYHLTSIFLHILAAIALYFFIRLIFYNTNIAFLASLLFLVHPINTETVCYISGISDSLSLFFIFLCLILYLKSFDSHTVAFNVLSLLSLGMALFSKENAVVVPVLILFYHYAFKKRLEINKIIPFFVLVISYVLLRLTVLSPFVHPDISFPVLLKRIPGFFAALTEYLRLLLLPFGLRVEYGDRLFNPGDFRVIAGILLAFVLVSAAFLKRKNNPLFFFSVAWFFIALLPVSNIVPVNFSFMMEHWLYLPSFGFCVVLASVLCSTPKNKNIILFLRVLAAVLLIFYSSLTFRQNEYWREPVAFYNRTLRYAPDSWRFYNELGLEYENYSKNDEAIASFQKALEIKPDLVGVYYNLANLYRKLGREKDALFMYNKAQGINQRLMQEYYERGKAYSKAQKEKEAASAYLRALELDPDNLMLNLELASSYIITGQYRKAITLLLRVIEISPDSALAYNNLAVAYYYDKQYDSAARYLNKAVELGYPVLLKFLQFMKNKTSP